MSGQFHYPAALHPGKEHPVTTGKEAGWAAVPGLDAVEKKKIPSPHRKSNPDYPIVQSVASHYTN
jgi:hypothetical protein